MDELQDNREKLKEIFLDKNRTYSKIGLDEKITIGMEIESEGMMNHKKIDLKRKSQTDGEIRKWKTIFDGSLLRGLEVVSPILTDNKEDVEDIYMVCKMLQEFGQKTGESCGGHIHIGADYLESKEAYINLFEIWGNTEKAIYKMSNEKEEVPRMRLKMYASPISSKLSKSIDDETVNLETEEDLDEFINKVQTIQENRCSGLNLLNVTNGKNTIEFRVPNGSINPDVWIENVRLFGRIVQVSQKLAEIEKQSEMTKEDRKLLDLKNTIKEEISEQEKVELLLELLFTEEEKSVYKERYIVNSKLLEQLPEEENPFKEIEFCKVDFKKKKHSLDEFRDVVIDNRKEIINETTRETMQAVRIEEDMEQSNDKDINEK